MNLFAVFGVDFMRFREEYKKHIKIDNRVIYFDVDH